jgi:hypothetical protein
MVRVPREMGDSFAATMLQREGEIQPLDHHPPGLDVGSGEHGSDAGSERL